MEHSDTPLIQSDVKQAETPESTGIALEMEDVGDLEMVLRGYYQSQIKKLELRKDRKLAKKLIENHLVLPKSRQRTSKDAAYIKEILGMEPILLERLEDSRLIRRINKRGNNPIYEISHDSLIEPILAGKRDREAINRFLKKAWKYVAVILLLWFLFGMMFENRFQVIPALTQQPKSLNLVLDKQMVGVQKDYSTFMLPLPPIIIDQELRPSDSIFVKLPLDPIRIASLGVDGQSNLDTIPVKLLSPIEVPIDSKERAETYQAFSNVVVPLAIVNEDSGEQNSKQLFANLSGNVKVRFDTRREGVARGGLNKRLKPIEMVLGDTLVQAEQSSKSVPLTFNMRLSDLFDEESDKNKVRNALGDRQVTFSYNVQLRPAAIKPPPSRVEYLPVKGIEVQYSDGTSRFIPGAGGLSAAGNGNSQPQIHIVSSGETLFSIAKKYQLLDKNGNTSTESLKKLNKLRGNNISVGQELQIPIQ